MTDNTSPITIVLLDPDPEDVASLSQLLSEEGFQVVAPAIDASLLDRAAHERPDLIIADPFAGDWDRNLVILWNLRRRPETSAVPLLIYTSDNRQVFFRQGTINTVLRATIVLKPSSGQQLLAAVHDSLEGRRT